MTLSYLITEDGYYVVSYTSNSSFNVTSQTCTFDNGVHYIKAGTTVSTTATYHTSSYITSIGLTIIKIE